MCMFSQPKVPQAAAPQLPKETAAMRAPDSGTVGVNARRRTTDQLRAASSTILTSPMGITTTTSDTAKKTLLGA